MGRSKTDEVLDRCPLCDHDVTSWECYSIALVAEEMSPASELPDFVDEETVRKNADRCLKCKYHPE